jgi:hypothetical protein
MHNTPHTSWPWPSKACRHHAGAAGFDRFGVRRREDVLLDVFFEEDERDFVFTVPTTLTAAPPATEDRRGPLASPSRR